MQNFSATDASSGFALSRRDERNATSRKRIQKTAFLFFILFLFSCNEKLVDASYGTTHRKSINGLDAMYSLIERRADTLLETSYLTRRVRKEADLIVFFEKSPYQYPADFFAKFEAWASGKKKYEISENLSEKRDSQKAKIPVYADLEDGDIEEKKKTLLYFLRDTTSDVPFWERVYFDLAGHARKQNYVGQILKYQKSIRAETIQNAPVPFGERFLSRKGGPLVFRKELVWNKDAFPSGVDYFPVRMISTRPLLPAQTTRILLQSTQREVLIREFLFPKIRLILVYNSEPFLNFSLVRKPYRRLAVELLDHALRSPQSRRKITEPTIAIIERAPVPAVSAKSKREEGLSRIFFVYPANLLVLSLLVFLLAFLYSRWPHEKRPLPNRKVGTRSFLEHFTALGKHLERSRDRDEALKRLLALRKKHAESSFRKKAFPSKHKDNGH